MQFDEAVALQRKYYAETASQYNDMHVCEAHEHRFALCAMLGWMEYLGIDSVLDLGSGTGRVLSAIKKRSPAVTVLGIEPVAELRGVGHAQGIGVDELVEGDAMHLDLMDASWDLVCAFGILHHVPTPRAVVSEMLRVARKAIFISDNNNFGQGSLVSRALKQASHGLGLWPLINFLKTGGRGYTVSEGDGVVFSYSVFNDFAYIKRNCKNVCLFNTTPAGCNLYRTASHLGLIGIK